MKLQLEGNQKAERIFPDLAAEIAGAEEEVRSAPHARGSRSGKFAPHTRRCGCGLNAPAAPLPLTPPVASPLPSAFWLALCHVYGRVLDEIRQRILDEEAAAVATVKRLKREMHERQKRERETARRLAAESILTKRNRKLKEIRQRIDRWVLLPPPPPPSPTLLTAVLALVSYHAIIRTPVPRTRRLCLWFLLDDCTRHAGSARRGGVGRGGTRWKGRRLPSML
jgi:hypothetical protein